MIAAITTLLERRSATNTLDEFEDVSVKRRVFKRLGLLILALFLFFGFVLSATLGVQRSFLIQGEGSSITITFSGGDTGWLFPEAIVCVPLERPNPRAQSVPGRLCPSSIYDEETSPNRSFGWQRGEAVQITVGQDGIIQIELLESFDPTRPVGSLIVLNREQWRTNGALAFQGFVEIGEDIGSGSTHYLFSGRWEARQTSLATSILRSITDVVKAGELARGTQAMVFVNGSQASMVGHVTPNYLSAESFKFVLLSEPGRTELRLEHYGLDEAVIVRPDWIDTAITSPLFLAAIVLLTLLALMTQIYGDLTVKRAPSDSGASQADSDFNTGHAPEEPPS